MAARRLPVLVLSVVLALGAAACGGDDGTRVDLPGGGQIDVGDDGGITVEGPSGDVSIGSGDYPDGWPSDFPVPEGASPAYAVGSASGVAVWFASGQDAQTLQSFFEQALPVAGYTIDSTVSNISGETAYTVMSITGGGWSGAVYMGTGLGSVAPGYAGSFDFWVTLAPAT